MSTASRWLGFSRMVAAECDELDDRVPDSVVRRMGGIGAVSFSRWLAQMFVTLTLPVPRSVVGENKSINQPLAPEALSVRLTSFSGPPSSPLPIRGKFAGIVEFRNENSGVGCDDKMLRLTLYLCAYKRRLQPGRQRKRATYLL